MTGGKRSQQSQSKVDASDGKAVAAGVSGCVKSSYLSGAQKDERERVRV